jgi:hypothetical protein
MVIDLISDCAEEFFWSSMGIKFYNSVIFFNMLISASGICAPIRKSSIYNANIISSELKAAGSLMYCHNLAYISNPIISRLHSLADCFKLFKALSNLHALVPVTLGSFTYTECFSRACKYAATISY